MKVLVTGGAGFIGHNVIRILEQQGHECVVLDTCTDYGFIPEEELDYLITNRLTRIKAKIRLIDIREGTFIDTIFKTYEPDVVIHMASFPRQKVVEQNPVLASDVMSTGLVNLLEKSKQYKVKKFVYISSSMVYGDFNLYGHEDMTCNPKGIYGILKLAGESLTRDHCERAGIEYTIVRPSAVYGPKDVLDRVVSQFLSAAMKNEELHVCGKNELLDFTYIDDCVDGIARAALSTKSNGKTYNVTRGHSRSLLEAAEVAVSVVGSGKIVIADANPRYPSRGTLSNIRAGQDFGHHGKVDIEEGFKKYYKWLQYFTTP